MGTHISTLSTTLKFYCAKFLLASQNYFLLLVSQIGIGCQDTKKIETILVFRTSALGDFIFSIPALVTLRKRYPEARIVLLTATTIHADQRKAVEAYAGKASLPWLSLVIPSVIDGAVCIHSFRLRNLVKITRLEVKKLKPDATVILAHPGDPGLGLLKKIIFLRFLGVRSRIYGWRARASIAWFRSVQHNAGLFEHHVVGPLRSVSEMPGIPAVEDMEIIFPLHVDSSSQAWANELWGCRQWRNCRVIAVAPGSIHSHKRWPLEKFVGLCQELVLHFNVSIVVIGTLGDRHLCQQLVNRVKGDVLNLAGETSISQSAAVLGLSTLLVGNDGGAMHLGSAMGCPVISIVPGIEYPNSIEPWFSQDLAVRHPVPCSPCYSFTNCPLGHNMCMKDLPIDEVYGRCAKVLSEE